MNVSDVDRAAAARNLALVMPLLRDFKAGTGFVVPALTRFNPTARSSSHGRRTETGQVFYDSA